MPAGPTPKAFVALLLVLESGTLATFAVLDLLLFFLAFETVLIPMYFLIARWGGAQRQAAAWKFILYTLLGSVVMLLGLLLIGIKAGTFDMVALATDNGRSLSTSVQVIAVLAIGIGLAVKTPMWPLHSWLPDAHTAAPTVGSVLLAGVMLKMGTYGFVRILLPVAPDGFRTFAPYLAAFAVVGIIYGSLACLALAKQGAKGDLKRLIAYSSVGHMGFVLLGISTMTPTGVNGALFANIAHGLITGLLFFLVGALKDRTGTTGLDTLAEETGAALYGKAPRLGGLLAFAAVASLGLPGLAGFWGEMLAMFGAFEPAMRPQPSRLSDLHDDRRVRHPAHRRVHAHRGPPRLHGRGTAGVAEARRRPDLRVRRLVAARRPHRHRRSVSPGPARPDRPGRTAAPRRRHPMSSLVQSVDWLAIAPPTLAAVVGLVVLVADLFIGDTRKAVLGWVSVAGLAASALLLLPLMDGDRSTFCLTGEADTCSYVADRFTLVIQLLVLGGALLVALLSVTALKDADRQLPEGEYWFLLLSSAAGAALLPASRDLATLIVALEVASLPAFALVGIKRGDKKSSEAALKFFLSSVTATAVSLMGISFVYATTGTLYLTQVADRIQHVDGQFHTLAQTGVVLTLVGFAFKTAAVPFHFWVPDTYVGAPLPIAAYLSVVGKAVGFSGLILVTVIAFPSYADVWGPALAALAALTMTVGNVGALRQRSTRAYSAVRLLAWSSVGQAGYLLVPIAAAAYSKDAGKAIGSTVAYALMYAAVNLGAFAVAALVARRSPLNRISDYRGLYAESPLSALVLGFFLLCLAGLPPGIIGLFAKVTVFSAAVGAGLGWLAVVMAVNVVIALFYYLQWTTLLFRAPEGEPGTHRTPVPLTTAIALTAVLGVVLSGAPQLILRFSETVLF